MTSSVNNKGYKLLLMWLISLAVLGLAYFVVVFPIRQAALQKKNEAAAMRLELKRMEQYVSRGNYERVLADNKKLKDMLESFVARNARANECSYIVSDIAGDVGVLGFTKMQNTSEKQSLIANCKHIRRAVVEVSCSGSYEKFLQLVNEYERSCPIVVIDKFSVSSLGRGVNNIEMSLLILLDQNQTDR